MTTYKIASIPGDGIGPEVVSSALQVLDALGEIHNFKLAITEFPWSCAYHLEHGSMMPENGLEILKPFDAIMLGAVGWPTVPDHVSLWGLLVPIRRGFDQYVCLRPVKLLPNVKIPLALDPGKTIDYVVIRENTEGEYSTMGGRIFPGTPREVVNQIAVFSRIGTERIIRYAFELAKVQGRKLVTSATKSNGIIHSMPFWDEIFADIALEYPEIKAEKMHVDALAAKFVLEPERFEVVVGSNLFGDILTDLGAATVGSIGIGASANINPERHFPSCFEPVHGSAPDIVGLGVANPLGCIWSGALMLEHLGEKTAATHLEQIMNRVLESGIKTRDLGGTANTLEVTQAMIAALKSGH
jgi:tartrate dehydrogenase/decarboxylase / D-malate dehydrogenase